MGGKVTVFGKPHVEHFEACLRDLALPKDKVAHVGDSLHHDVVGANATGIDSIFVAGGVHREELGTKLGEIPSRAVLENVFRHHGVTPTHVVPLFKM
jgi:ribonucleotide monophosphatase NagD (HAD superfamily)